MLAQRPAARIPATREGTPHGHASSPMTDAGRRLGPWTLHELLGSGGNAEVYRATDTVGREVALKVIKARKPEREPYRRFVREIEVLQALEDKTGILPVVDAHLPANPSREDRPWLAMSIATPLAGALQGEPLELVVTAVAAIAATLARLHEQGIGHRDIKPSNLHRLADDWLIGDFGLVAGPDTRGLTPGDRPLGPVHFMPYEMIVNPQTADPKAAGRLFAREDAVGLGDRPAVSARRSPAHRDTRARGRRRPTPPKRPPAGRAC